MLALLRQEAPRYYELAELAEVVGKWVWIQFQAKQSPDVTRTLAQLGFHWNNKRQAWQHPCGQVTDFSQAALEMARLITGPCWLVPIPSSTGDTIANAILCSQIAGFVPGARTVKAIIRTQPIESQCQRHRRAAGPITPAQHHFKRSPKFLEAIPVYLVDNVTTSGNTLQAAHDALAFGTGLVFADAATHQTQLQTELFTCH